MHTVWTGTLCREWQQREQRQPPRPATAPHGPLTADRLARLLQVHDCPEGLTRAKLAALTGTPQQQVNNLLACLLKSGRARVVGQVPGTGYYRNRMVNTYRGGTYHGRSGQDWTP